MEMQLLVGGILILGLSIYFGPIFQEKARDNNFQFYFTAITGAIGLLLGCVGFVRVFS